MASSYVNDLRLEEIANGEASGTWGTKTNVNLELIGEALGFGTRAIADASTDNITIADGASDNDRALYLVLTGGGQTCTVTLLPNTSSKVWIMKNSTSFALAFTQGSGANVSIAAGETKVIATNGAGSGAIVYELDGLSQSNATVGTELVLNGKLSVDATPAANSTANGPQTATLNAGYACAAFDLVYLGSSSTWLEADSDAVGTSINMLGVTLAAADSGAAVNVALPGAFIRFDTFDFTPGLALYVSGTLGAMTHTKPSGSGDIVRAVGYALNADTVFFQPSSDYVVLA
jgi:hypothetical protein